MHQNYLSSQVNTNFIGNSNDIVNNPVTGDSYHLPYDSVELEKETNYPPGAGKPSPERFCGHQFYCRWSCKEYNIQQKENNITEKGNNFSTKEKKIKVQNSIIE